MYKRRPIDETERRFISLAFDCVGTAASAIECAVDGDWMKSKQLREMHHELCQIHSVLYDMMFEEEGEGE